MSEYGIWIFAAIMIGAFFLLKSRGGIGQKEAQAYLAEGAVVIDVRTQGEYAAGHLTKAKHIPLDQLAGKIAEVVPDKNTVILCHCASGMRSGSAASQLRRMGYTKSFNLGSFHRAAKIVGD